MKRSDVRLILKIDKYTRWYLLKFILVVILDNMDTLEVSEGLLEKKFAPSNVAEDEGEVWPSVDQLNQVGKAVAVLIIALFAVKDHYRFISGDRRGHKEISRPLRIRITKTEAEEQLNLVLRR